MIVSITGHRPEKIPDPQMVKDSLRMAFGVLEADVVIQGMAAGVDLWSARVAFESDIPFWCAKPWFTHTAREEDKDDYDSALKHAQKVVNVTDYKKYPGPWVYQKRNEWMVDNGDLVIAVWDGSRGGTYNCVQYAKSVGRRIWMIDPVTGDMGWLQ